MIEREWEKITHSISKIFKYQQFIVKLHSLNLSILSTNNCIFTLLIVLVYWRHIKIWIKYYLKKKLLLSIIYFLSFGIKIMISCRIVNVVATGYIGHRLNLDDIAKSLSSPNIVYNPHKFSAAIYRMKDPRATFLLFSSGKFVCVGTRSVLDAEKSSNIMVQSLQQICNSETTISDFTIRNIVGTFNTGFKISLENFYDSKRANCIFEQEFFPGLKFVPSRKEKKTILLFVSGKVIITGCKKEEEIPEVTHYMKRMLLKFKR